MNNTTLEQKIQENKSANSVFEEPIVKSTLYQSNIGTNHQVYNLKDKKITKNLPNVFSKPLFVDNLITKPKLSVDKLMEDRINELKENLMDEKKKKNSSRK